MSHELLAEPLLDRPTAQADKRALVFLLPHVGQAGLAGRPDRLVASSSNRAPHERHLYSKRGISHTSGSP